MATPGTPVLDSNVAPVYLIPCSILAALALSLCTARIWTRLSRTNHMGLDDYLIVIAEVLSFSNMFIVGASTSYGWGHPYLALTPSQYTQIMKLQFANQTIWVITIAMVRISVACSLLRFGMEWKWRVPLYTLITFQLLTSFGWLIVQFFQCRPLRSFWDIVPDAKCWPVKAIIDYGWFSSAFYTTMDLILALMPIKLVRSLNRPLSEKILIGCLMATGLLATGIAGAKMTTFNSLGQGDPMQATVKPSMWAKLEELVGIIAACMPCLKSPAQNLLRRLGLFSGDGMGSRPSFVKTLSLKEVGKAGGRDDGSEEDVDRIGKAEIRIDSVSVAARLGDERGDLTANTSVQGDAQSRKQGWEAV
ncbi:uncharacterized protein BDR25DRAFT_339869 [Lindgomyces ingoldianus]|uniref:Uncharacterized protein n=1 Tax=Lindgomyces ingoldianus TaxID=673940 RepID=A0ACB6RBN5_9PLEO|nr:uncharacterized protein BDR25DRAFT_339869 [Lindgomyces ingoldianus]KAF2475932.1 hypothetical protein BDR25DRAFT_339869 [Lindgomyces ingoldianus]